MPMAVNCCWVPLAIAAVAGVTTIDISVAAVTRRVTATEVTPPSVAVTRVVPALEAVASPALLMAAVVGVPDCHDTEDVTS